MRVSKTFLFCGLVFCGCAEPQNDRSIQNLDHTTTAMEYRQPDPATIALIDSLRSVIDSLTGNTPVAAIEPAPVEVVVATPEPAPTPKPEPAPTPAESVVSTIPKTALSSPDDPFNKISLEPSVSGIKKKVVPPPVTKSKTTSGRLAFSSSTYNYGQIKEGKQIYHVFKFKNTGSQPISIISADVTCGCTTPTYPKTPIQPGQSGNINVHYNSNGKMASQHSVITLYTDGQPTFKELHLEGYVMPIWKDEIKPAPKPNISTKPANTTKPAATNNNKPADLPKEETPPPTPTPQPKEEVTPAPKPEAKPAPKPEAKPEEAPKETPKVDDEATPGL